MELVLSRWSPNDRPEDIPRGNLFLWNEFGFVADCIPLNFGRRYAMYYEYNFVLGV